MIDFQAINQHLLARCPQLLFTWFPQGKLAGQEFVIGDISGKPGKSLSVNLKTGIWSDFSTGDAGRDLISLYARKENIKDIDAAKFFEPETKVSYARPKPEPAATSAEIVYKPVVPVPDDVPAPKFAKNAKVWEYQNVDGQTLGYIARIDTPEGERKYLPQTWDGNQWQYKTWPKNRPLYGLPRLKESAVPVLLVEGEKTADAAYRLVGDRYAVLAWPGGAKAVSKVDFSPIYNRKIVLFPDDDNAGRSAMWQVYERIRDFCDHVHIVENSENTGWDAADAFDDEWDGERLLAFINARLKRLGVISAPAAEPPPTTLSEVSKALQVGIESAPQIQLPVVNHLNKPISCVENFAAMLKILNITVRYNVIKKRDDILVPNTSFTVDNQKNASIAYLKSCCVRLGLPKETVTDFLCYQAESNLYNPVIDWIESNPWDGVSRIQEFYDTIKAKDELLKEIFLRRWMISAVAAAYEPEGIVSRGILVFQGAQNLGKTHWFKKLVPSALGVLKDGALLRPEDKDSVFQIISNWLVELGELDATFRRADVAQLKAFITKQHDELRRPYAHAESNFARRTVFFGSVNPREYLSDPTGSSRYWTVECIEINHQHTLDMQQVFAEFASIYKSGESWHLTPEEFARMNASNEDYNILDPIEDRFLTAFDWSVDVSLWQWLSSTETATKMGIDRPTKSDTTQIGLLHLKKLGASERFRKKRNGARMFLMPPLYSETRNEVEPEAWWHR